MADQVIARGVIEVFFVKSSPVVISFITKEAF